MANEKTMKDTAQAVLLGSLLNSDDHGKDVEIAIKDPQGRTMGAVGGRLIENANTTFRNNGSRLDAVKITLMASEDEDGSGMAWQAEIRTYTHRDGTVSRSFNAQLSVVPVDGSYRPSICRLDAPHEFGLTMKVRP